MNVKYAIDLYTVLTSRYKIINTRVPMNDKNEFNEVNNRPRS